MENFPQEERKGFVRDTMRKLSIHMPRSEASFQSKLAQYEIEIKDLQERIRVVEHDSEDRIASEGVDGAQQPRHNRRPSRQASAKIVMTIYWNASMCLKPPCTLT